MHEYFSTRDATRRTYSDFIQRLRRLLTHGRRQVHGIPVLPRRENVRNPNRFVFAYLTTPSRNPNTADLTITVAIDVVNVYVVGYAVGGQAYILGVDPNDQNPAPVEVLFRDRPRTTLRFTGHYGQLSRYAEPASRAILPDYNGNRSLLEQIRLGRNELEYAIRLLHGERSRESEMSLPQHNQAYGLTVVIVMLAEVARFPYIESLLLPYMGDNNRAFTPDVSTLTLINSWSDLSQQIQRVHDNQTCFPRTIELRTITNRPMQVTNLRHRFLGGSSQGSGIAMLLYDRDQANLFPEGLNHDEH